MRQEEFEKRYQTLWNKFEQAINVLTRFKKKNIENTVLLQTFADDYRQICYCLALARERQYSPHLINQLESFAFQGHQLLYRKRLGVFNRVYQFILYGLPQAVREQAKFVWIASLLFYLPALAIFGFTLLFPELIYSLVEPDMVARIESMYDPALDKIGRERQADTDFMMFGYYIRNNIGIAFQSFAGGILATIGTQFFLIFNGTFFGGVSAHIINIGYQETFYSFVAGHSSYELTGIVLSGAAGLQIGWAVIAPGCFSRKQALINAGRRSMSLVYGAFFLLLIAAFVEAFWSSNTTFSVMTKYWVGIAGWLAILSYFFLAGRRSLSQYAAR